MFRRVCNETRWLRRWTIKFMIGLAVLNLVLFASVGKQMLQMTSEWTYSEEQYATAILEADMTPEPAEPTEPPKRGLPETMPIEVGKLELKCGMLCEFEMMLTHNETKYLVTLSDKPTPEIKIIHELPNLCASIPNLRYMIYVHSAPENAENRNILRQTWAAKKMWGNGQAKAIFLLGVPYNQSLQQNIDLEFEEHGDIVQGDFVDVYRNSTLKGMMGMKWIKEHCSSAQFVIKAIDDVTIDMIQFTNVMEEELADDANAKQFYCDPIIKSGIDRWHLNEWYVPKNQLKTAVYYPPYCEAHMYAFTMSALHEMYSIASTMPYFFTDEIFFTGFVVPQIKGLKYLDISERMGKDGHVEYKFGLPWVIYGCKPRYITFYWEWMQKQFEMGH